MTLEIDDEMGKRLEQLARDTDRSLHEMLYSAIENFYAEERSIADDLLAGERDIEAGHYVPHEEVAEWVRSLGTATPLPMPNSRNRVRMAS